MPAAGQPAKIADLFAGVRLYGLLGFVWFDHRTNQDWRLTSPAAIAAFRRGAASYRQPPSAAARCQGEPGSGRRGGRLLVRLS